MPRKNFGVSTGRPKKTPFERMTPAEQKSAGPMDNFKPAIPASAFKKGGKVSYCEGGTSLSTRRR